MNLLFGHRIVVPLFCLVLMSAGVGPRAFAKGTATPASPSETTGSQAVKVEERICHSPPNEEIKGQGKLVSATGIGASLSEARSRALEGFAGSIGWPAARALPEVLANLARLGEVCMDDAGGRTSVRLEGIEGNLRMVMEEVVRREQETLDTFATLARHPRRTVSLPSALALRAHMSDPGRTAWQTLLGACAKLGGCSRTDAEVEVRALAILEASREDFEFMFAPEDDTARTLLTEIEASLRPKGFTLRDISVTNVSRQLHTRCQAVYFPRATGESLRVVELSCEADALVKGERFARLRFAGRGQDLNPDDALADARKRLALEEFSFVTAEK